MELSEKIKLLRETEGHTQEKMAGLLKISKSAYQKYELNERKPEYDIAQKLCQQFPEYTLWLMTRKTSGEQIEPYMKHAQSNKTG